ncbi:hypothetical protein ACOSQ2_015553 [Xanthoceras sorbifolium]
MSGVDLINEANIFQIFVAFSFPLAVAPKGKEAGVVRSPSLQVQAQTSKNPEAVKRVVGSPMGGAGNRHESGSSY